MAPEKRVRTGCATCRRRRVKCDEKKPTCGRCQSANFVCEGYDPPRVARVAPSSSTVSSVISVSATRQTSPSSSISSQEDSPSSELSWRHSNWQQEQLPLYHHFVTTTVVRLFRKDHISFWRDQVAQMSFNSDLVYESLLAVGALHRATLLACQESNAKEATKFRVLGYQAYGNALKLLPGHLSQNSEIFTSLVSLMLLTYFEIFMEYPKGAFRHLWMAIQVLRNAEERLSQAEIANLVPLHDTMLSLDFLAQKLVPYARSSFLRVSDRAFNESPFWNRPSLEFSGCQSDSVATERYRLIQLIGGHNKLSRVVWGNWCPTNERPTRDELMGFYAELLLWKANSPATFASCCALASIDALNFSALDLLPIPPPEFQFLSDEAALTIGMYNGYLGCTLAMISTTDEDPTVRQLECHKLVYQNFCIAAGLLETQGQSGSSYKPCDAVGAGISVFLYHGARRCYSRAWQQWTVDTLRSTRSEGLSSGLTFANALEIMFELEDSIHHNAATQRYKSENTSGQDAFLGFSRDRLMPLLIPRGEHDSNIAYYLRYGTTGHERDERVIQVVAKATWKQDYNGSKKSLNLDVYDPIFTGYEYACQPEAERPQILDLLSSWRQQTEKGWHGYLAKDIQDDFLRKEVLAHT